MRRALLALLLLLTAGAARGGCKVQTLAELPVTMVGQQPIIEVKLEGVPMRMIADSGAFYSIISPGSAAQLHLRLEPLPPGFSMQGLGGYVTPQLAVVKDVDLSGIPLHNMEFLAGGSELGFELAGVIGRNVLSYADVEFDLAGGMIRLLRREGCNGLALSYWARPGQGIGDVSLDEAPHGLFNPPIIGEALVNGRKIRVMFDSGAGRSGLSLAAARRLGLDPKTSAAIPAGLSWGFGRRMVDSWITPVDSFEIGGEKITPTRLRILDSELPDADMLVGADFFLSHRIYVANSQHRVYFTYNGGPVFNLEVQGAATSRPDSSESAPTDAAGFARRAAAEAGRHDFTSALTDYDKAATFDPKSAEVLYRRGETHLAIGESAKARADFDAALVLAPDDAEALMSRAQLRRATHDAAGALADLDAADKALPAPANARLALAQEYLSIDAPDRAISQYDLWVKVHPDDAHLGQALSGRCWTRVLLGADLDKAKADCQRALRLPPVVARAVDSVAFIELRAGDLDAAIAAFDKAIAAEPQSALALYGRGLAELKKGQTDKGQADLAAAKTLSPGLAASLTKHGLGPPA